MRVTIIKPDNMVGVDGVFLQLDLTSLPSNLRVVQWNGSSGHVEWTDKGNTSISSLAEYQTILSAWSSRNTELEAIASDPYYGLSTSERASKKLEDDLRAIDLEVQEADKEPFEYDGNLYYPDTEFIQGIFSVLPLLPSNYTENWKTAEKEADGLKNKKVILNKAGITGLALAYLQFKKSNWLAGEIKKEALKDAFLEGA